LATIAAALPARRPLPARQGLIRPGEVWLDTAGKPIQAHGASILQVGDTFYWYGENKERTLPGSGIWHWGVRAYASKDLVNWADQGLIVPPVPDDPASPLHPAKQLDRPHILYNAGTRKFVCWVKIMETDGRQTRTILTADRFTGPYTIIRHGLQPLGMNAGDFDLVINPDDLKAYTYFERVHSELICADLSGDYTDVTGYYSTHFPHPAPPQVRGACLFPPARQALPDHLGHDRIPSQPVRSGDRRHIPRAMDRIGRSAPQGCLAHILQLAGQFGVQTSGQEGSLHCPGRPLDARPAPDRRRGLCQRRCLSPFRADVRQDVQSRRACPHPGGRRGTEGAGRAINTSRGTYVWLPLRFEGERPSSTGAARGVRTTSPDGDVLNERLVSRARKIWREECGIDGTLFA
jgi:hypothetical protein